jgi:hypothetical protein
MDANRSEIRKISGRAPARLVRQIEIWQQDHLRKLRRARSGELDRSSGV